MPFEVVDRDEREPARPRHGLRSRDPDEQRADETGALRHRKPVDLTELRACVGQRLANDRRHELEMPARGDLGHDAAVPRVQDRLRGDDRRKHFAPVGHDSRGSLVARGLDSEDHDAFSAFSDGADSRHMIKASSRLSV